MNEEIGTQSAESSPDILPELPSDDQLQQSAEEAVQISEVVKTKKKLNRTYPAYALGAEQFRPWLVKILRKGGMVAGDLMMMAEKEFKAKMLPGDLIPAMSGDGKRVQFPTKWQHRLYCAREGMVKDGLMYAPKHFPRKAGWWQLTPKGLLPENKSGYLKKNS